MNLNHKNILILLFLFFIPSAKSAENLFIYKGNFSRTIKIEDLNNFTKTKKPSKKLKNLMKITNQNNKDLHKFLSYNIICDQNVDRLPGSVSHEISPILCISHLG